MRTALSFLCLVWASLAGMPFAMSSTESSADWELGNAQYQDFAATPDSKLVRDTLALPLGDDLQSAEVARLDLAIMRQAEDATLLKTWMDYDVAAAVLGLPARPASSVGEAIQRQRASPALLDPYQRRAVYRAVATRFPRRSAEGGVVLESKHAYILADGNMSFGYPANDHDNARTIAHSRLSASSCVDRGTCSRLTYFLQQPSTRHGFSLALSIATWLAIAVALIAFAVQAPGTLVYPGFVIGVPLLIVGAFSLYAVNDNSALIGIIFGVVYGIPIGVGCALVAALLRYVVRKTRGARIPAADAES